MSHNHDHHHSENKTLLLISFIIIFVYMFIEFLGGLFTGSLALLSDAGHMLSDAISLFVALLAVIFGQKKANILKTFGYKRFEVLAALFNGMTLILIAIYIIYEAILRFYHPININDKMMFIISFIGLFVNLLVFYILTRNHSHENINIKGALLHVFSDILGSIGVIIAALLIYLFNWTIADPIISIIISLLILRSGFSISKETLHILMEGTPKTINFDEISQKLTEIPQIIDIHDLHIWNISSNQNLLSCHIVVDINLSLIEIQHLLKEIEAKMKNNGINHITIQVETNLHSHNDSILCQSYS